MSAVDALLEEHPAVSPVATPPAAPSAPATEPAPVVRLRGDALRIGLIVVLMATAVQRGVGLARGALFCRWLPDDQLGEWDLAYGFLMLAAPVAVLGLPGSFGRYLEYFRLRGQFRGFLKRTCIAIAALTVVAAIVLAAGRHAFAAAIFGGAHGLGVVWAMVPVLLAVVLQNTVTSMLAAMRLVRAASAVQFANSLGFAVIGSAFVLLTDWGPAGIVLAFGAACLLSSLGGGVAIAKSWRETPSDAAPLAPRDLWSRLLPFALWLWLTNWLANLFELSDRYLLLHFGNFSEGEALSLIGQYHSARLIPVAFLGLAELVGAILTPYLARDWEEGRRERVSQRLNAMLTCAALSLTLVGAAVLALAPWLFEFAFAGKYARGLHVLPWTLASCCFSAATIVAQNYLWCAERPRWPVAAIVLGLAANVCLNLVLLPRFGLWGTVVSTAVAHAITLAAVLVFNWRAGMKLDRTAIVAAALPGLLGFGPWWALAGATAFAAWFVARLRGGSARNP